MTDALQRMLDALTGFLTENPLVGAWYTTVVALCSRWLPDDSGRCNPLAVEGQTPGEVWGYLAMANGVRLPITHWENIIGRAPACDVQIEYPSSRASTPPSSARTTARGPCMT